MLLRRWMPAAALAALLALSLGACTPGDAVRTPGRTAVATPLFTSDDEALKAATNAYAAYLKVTDEVLHDGGTSPERFAAVATGKALENAMSDAAEFRTRRAHTTGQTTFLDERLSFYRAGASNLVEIFVCDDVAAVDVVDSNGKSLVSTDRRARTPWQVDLRPDGLRDRLIVSSRMAWDGADFCGS